MAETNKSTVREKLYLIFLVLAVAIIIYLLVTGNRFLCKDSTCPIARQTEYEDGTYRGIFADGDEIQVNVQFTLQDGIVSEARFRHLRRDENYNIDTEYDPYKSVVNMYIESLDYLVGKDLKEHLPSLYYPENIVSTEIDGYTAATIRSNKIVSAIRDALNRGVYSY